MNPTAYDFRLQSTSPAINAGVVISGITNDYVGAAPDIGAYEFGGTDWTAGHDFSSPPDPVFESVSLLYVNNVRQSDFEKGIISPWAATYSDTAASVSVPRSGSKSVRLGPGEDGIEQVLTGLSPNTSYMCTAWVKADIGERIQIGVNGFEGTDASATSDSTSWTMVNIPFTTGAGATRATVYAYKNPGTAYVYVDDFGVVEQ